MEYQMYLSFRKRKKETEKEERKTKGEKGKTTPYTGSDKDRRSSGIRQSLIMLEQVI